MTYSQMISLLPEKTSPATNVARAFFSAQTTLADRKAFLCFLLQENRYEQLLEIVYCRHINGNIDMKNTGADYLSVTGEDSTIHMRYFSLFIQIALECGLKEEEYMPLLVKAAASGRQNGLRVWKIPSERYLSLLADTDYDKAYAYIKKYDVECRLLSILAHADKDRTVKEIIEIALFGKGVNKVSLRNFLRGYKQEVYAYVRDVYDSLKTENRVAAVRLLLLFKNDAQVGDYLRDILHTEKSKSVRKLLQSGKSQQATPALTDTKQVVRFFYNAMVRGTSVSQEEFLYGWILPPCAQVADSLFFGIYVADALYAIAVVDNGKVFDLSNMPLTLPQNCRVKVLHPAELTAKTEFLTRLNITQPFEQIKRKVYLPSAEDRQRNSCFGVAGSMVKAGDFKNAMRKNGFRVLNRDRDGVCGQVGVCRDGIWCVLNIVPIVFAAIDSAHPILAQFVRFYDDKNVIKLGGQVFVEGVAPLAIAQIDPRMFSEFMYSVYELMGCR